MQTKSTETSIVGIAKRIHRLETSAFQERSLPSQKKMLRSGEKKVDIRDEVCIASNHFSNDETEFY